MVELDNYKPESPRGVEVAAPEFQNTKEHQIAALLRIFVEKCQFLSGSSIAEAAPTARQIARQDSARLRPRQDSDPEDLLPDLGQDSDAASQPMAMAMAMEVQSDEVEVADYSPPGSRSPSPPQNPR